MCFMRLYVIFLSQWESQNTGRLYFDIFLFFSGKNCNGPCIYPRSRKQNIAGDMLRYRLRHRFVPYAEIGSRDPNLNSCNVNMFCTVQCSHQSESESVSHYTKVDFKSINPAVYRFTRTASERSRAGLLS